MTITLCRIHIFFFKFSILHIRALYWKRSPDEIIKVQKDIKMVFDNTFIIEQIIQDILRHFSFYFDTIGYGIRFMVEMLFDIEYRLSYRIRILIRLSISVFKISDTSIFIAILKKERHLYFIHKYIIHKQKI